MKRPLATLFLMLLPLLSGFLQAPTTPLHTYAGTPSYRDIAKPLPVTTIGPTAPAIVTPGSCFNVVLEEDLDVSIGYMWQVIENDSELLLKNYTIITNKLEPRTLEICIPRTLPKAFTTLN